jgi:hypothetical protein
MKVNIKQEGGFMGLASKTKVDYKTLTEEEQKILDAIVERAMAQSDPPSQERASEATHLEENPQERGLETPHLEKKPQEQSVEAPKDAAPAPLLRASVPADMLCYSVSMRKDGKKVEVAFDDTNAPPELIAFFQKYMKF